MQATGESGLVSKFANTVTIEREYDVQCSLRVLFYMCIQRKRNPHRLPSDVGVHHAYSKVCNSGG